MVTAVNPETGERIELRDGQWVPITERVPDRPFLQSMLNAYAQGATMGGLDELYGGVSELTGGDYESASREMRAQTQQFSEDAPWTSGLLNVAGALSTAPYAASKFATTKAAPWLMSNVPRWAQWAGGGALGGATAGALDAPPGERFEGAARGGAIGGTFGLGGLWVSEAAKWGARTVGDFVRLLRSPNARARQELGKALADSGLTPDEAVDALQRYGDDAVLADIIPDAAETVAQQSGPGRGAMQQFLTGRQMGQHSAALRELTDVLDDPATFRQTVQRMDDEALAAARPLYDDAFNRQIVQTDALADLMQRPTVREAMDEAIREVQDEGGMMAQMLYRDAQGETQFRALPTLRHWDYVKRGLDNLIDNGTDAVTGKMNPAARRAYNIKREILTELDDQVPTYAQARATYATGAANQRALERGMKFTRMADDEVDDIIADMSQSELQNFRAGAMRSIKKQIDDAPDGADVYKRIFGSDSKRNRLRSLFNDDDAFSQFSDRMEGLAAAHRVRGQALGGSPTARRLQQQPPSTLFEAGRNVLEGTVEAMQSGSGERVRNEMARMLIDPQAVDVVPTLPTSRLLPSVPRAGVEELYQPVLFGQAAGRY